MTDIVIQQLNALVDADGPITIEPLSSVAFDPTDDTVVTSFIEPSRFITEDDDNVDDSAA